MVKQNNRREKMKYKTMAFAGIVFCLMLSCSKPIQWTLQNVSYGTDERQTFNIITPKGKNEAHAIVYIHGGFYHSGNKLWHPLFLTDFSENNIFVTTDYRLIGDENKKIHITDMIEDIDNALIKIMDISNEYGITVKDFILVGHSAGAHIGLLYGYKYFQENDNRQIKIAACISLSGPADYTDDFGWSSMAYYGGTLERRLSALSWIGTELTDYEIQLTQYNWTKQNNWPEYKKYAEDISPVFYINKTKKLPPTLLIHGMDDRIVPYSNSVKLNAMLDETSVPHKLITVTGKGNNHMLGGKSNRTDSVKPIKYKDQIWINEAKEWMETYLNE
jgi:acetyl esterase/lipase